MEETSSTGLESSVDQIQISALQKESKYNSLHYFTAFSQLGGTLCRLNRTESELAAVNMKIIQTRRHQLDRTERYEGFAKRPIKEDRWARIDQGQKTIPIIKIRRQIMLSHAKGDFKVNVGGVTFQCVKMLLQAYSTKFYNLLPKFCGVDLHPSLTVQGFQMAYDWMLCDRPILRLDSLPELYDVARQLGIRALEHQCWRCYDNDLCLRELVAFRMYQESMAKLQACPMRELFLSRVCKYFLALVADEAFLRLNLAEVVLLLSSSAIGVNQEAEVFMSAVRWLFHEPQRLEHACTLMGCVRFSLMPSNFLSLLKLKRGGDMKPILGLASVQRKISEAIAFTTNMSRREMTKAEFVKFLEVYKLEAPRERQWIIDYNCPYHHQLLCWNAGRLNLRIFQQYMGRLRQSPDDPWRDFEFTTFDGARLCPNERCRASGSARRELELGCNRQLAIDHARETKGEPLIQLTPDLQKIVAEFDDSMWLIRMLAEQEHELNSTIAKKRMDHSRLIEGSFKGQNYPLLGSQGEEITDSSRYFITPRHDEAEAESEYPKARKESRKKSKKFGKSVEKQGEKPQHHVDPKELGLLAARGYVSI